MRQKIFLAHSHHDQNVAYGVTEWMLNLWPDLSVFLTHNGLSELDRLVPHYYLHAIPGSNAFICIISRDCFASNAIFDELKVAAAASCNIILVIQPNMTPEDKTELAWVIQRWEQKYGNAIDLGKAESDQKLLKALCRALERSEPVTWHPGSLDTALTKVRAAPKKNDLPLPNLNAILSGKATRDESVKWFAIMEKWLDNRLRSGGISVERLPRIHSLENRVLLFLLSSDPEVWVDFMFQLSPLINDDFRKHLDLIMRHATDETMRKQLSDINMLSYLFA